MNHIHSDTLAGWLAGIERLHPKNIEMGLERVRIVKESLDIRFDCPVVTVGGTNGKGSTCTMMQSIWQKAGYRVGLYMSPHIHHFGERLRIDGNTVSEETFVHYFKMVEKARSDTPLTFFEFTTLTILQILADAKLDVVILEVGLGGRLDAVNLIDADVAVVTNVDIDHVDYLGHTQELIGYEKAGIFRQGRVAVYGDYNPPHSLVQYADEIGADLHIHGRDYSSLCQGDRWSYIGPARQFDNLEPPALHGKNQVKNAANALMVLEALQEVLPFDETAVRAALSQVYLPGRFQMLQKEPLVIVDAAHNPHAAVVLADNLRSMGDFHATYAVFGAMSDKDIDGVIGAMRECVDFWYLTGLPLLRAATPEMLQERLIAAGIRPDRILLFDTAMAALTAAKMNTRKNDKIIAFGSFWIVTGVTQTESSDSRTSD